MATDTEVHNLLALYGMFCKPFKGITSKHVVLRTVYRLSDGQAVGSYHFYSPIQIYADEFARLEQKR